MRKALIVEDDHAQADLTARMLERYDIESVLAETGQRGLELARTVKPDVVLLDLMLPDINGFEVCQQLRREAETRATPIVMITALNEEVHRRRGFRVGANAYVPKPFGIQDLADAIAKAGRWKQQLEHEHVAGEIHLELNSESGFLHEVNDFLATVCEETPLKENQIAQLRQAILEIGQNAIEWGNRHRTEELVRITYRVYSDRVEIVVRDEGEGFDPASLPHAACPDDPLAHMEVREKMGLREGGFGLLICRGMLDELRYNQRGNEVTLIKRFPPRNGTSSNS